jgi:hypothetical protein
VRVKKKEGGTSEPQDDTVIRVKVEGEQRRMTFARPESRAAAAQRDKSRSVTGSVTVRYKKSAIFSSALFNGMDTHYCPPALQLYLSRRSLQHVQDKSPSHLQLEYPPVFRAPVTGGVMFLTGDDTTITGFFFLSGIIITRTVVLYCTDIRLYFNV